MSDEFNGISLDFTINVKNIDSLRENIRKGLKKEAIKIENVEVSSGAINTIRSSIRKSFEERALSINKIAVTNDAISSFRTSIREKLKKNSLTINNLKAGNLSLKGATLTNMNDLRKSVAEAISAGAYSVKITHVDASEAIKKVQSQLTQALNASGFGGIKEISASSRKSKAVTDTPQKEQLTHLAQVRKELGKIETASNKSGLLGRSDTIKASINSLKEYIDGAVKSVEKIGIQGDVAFNQIKTAIDKDMVAINQMIEAANNPILRDLSKSARATNTRVASGKDAITDVETLSLLDGKWQELQGKIRQATELIVQFGDPEKIQQSLLTVEREAAAYSEMVSVLKELNRYGVAPILSGGLDVETWKEQLSEVRDIDAQLDKLKKKMASATTAGKNDITGGENFTEIENRYNRLVEARERVRTANRTEDVEGMTTSFLEEARAIDALIEKEKELIAEQNRATKRQESQIGKQNAPAKDQTMANLANQMQSYIDANTSIFRNGATKNFGVEIQSYIGKLNEALAGASVVTDSEVKRMNTNFKNMKREIKDLGVSGQTMFERFTKGFKKFGGWMVVTSVLMQGVRVIHQAVTNIFDLDKAMTELRKVTDETATSYENFFKTAEERSKVVGATLTDLVNATADFSRLGYNMTDAEGLAEVAILYRNVGDGIDSVNDSSQSIISSLKAFYNEGEAALNQIQEAQHIVDVYNELGNSFPIDSKGVGDALTRSAAALSTAGNTFEESAALAVAANAIVQDPEKVGKRMCPATQQCVA